MIVFSHFDKTGKKYFFITLAAAVLITAVVASVCVFTAEPPAYAQYDGITYSTSVRNENEIHDFADQFGLKLSDAPIYLKTVTVPEVFNDVYQNYEKLQEKVGLDLDKHKGEECQLVRYAIDEYNGKKGYLLELLMCHERVIAGSIFSEEFGGEMLSLSGQK